MNSLPLSSFVISYLTRFYWENCCLQILRNSEALNSYLGLPALDKKDFVSIKFDKGGNSLPKHFERTENIRSNLQISLLSRILAEFVFKYFSDNRRILALFQGFASIRFSQHDCTVT